MAFDSDDYVACDLSPSAHFLLTMTLENFARTGMVRLAEPDEHGLARVSLTDTGLARYKALCEQATRTTNDT